MIMCELVLKGSTRLFSLTDEEGKYIVRLARATIENKLGLSEAPNVADAPKVTQEKWASSSHSTSSDPQAAA
jgi:hypothetical protein